MQIILYTLSTPPHVNDYSQLSAQLLPLPCRHPTVQSKSLAPPTLPSSPPFVSQHVECYELEYSPNTSVSGLCRPIPTITFSNRTALPRRVQLGANKSNLIHIQAVPISVPPQSHTVNFALLNSRSINNKCHILNDIFTSKNLDFLFLTETWVVAADLSSFTDVCPPNSGYLNTPRLGKAGGVATVFKNNFRCKPVPIHPFETFELQLFRIDNSLPVLCALIYRPPKPNPHFVHEFSELLSFMFSRCERLLILGDFNVHICCPQRPMVKEFLALINSFNLIQSSYGPTHNKGHCLDLVLSSGLSISTQEIYDPGVSDHYLIAAEFVLLCPSPQSPQPQQLARTITSSTASTFVNMFNAALPPQTSADLQSGTDDLFAHFDSLCTDILNSIAPLKAKKFKSKPPPWLNDSTQALRQAARQAERKWKKNKLQVSYDIFRKSLKSYEKAVKEAKNNYLSHLITSNADKPQVLFQTINKILHPVALTPTFPATVESCELLKNFFTDKISQIRMNISPSQSGIAPIPASQHWSHFATVTPSLVTEVALQLKTTSCFTDTIPVQLFKDVLTTISPFVTDVINSSLTTGEIPSHFKYAIVHPLLKKAGLDSQSLSNYRPISTLPFISKLLEKIVSLQLSPFIHKFNIFDNFQSGFRPFHSTESALLKVLNDIFLIVDSGSSAVLILLDLSAAFDTVDHQILLNRLEVEIGLSGLVLKWFHSYLSDRKFSVKIGSCLSSPAKINCGLPQGSILAPVLFSLYMLPLGRILTSYNIHYHLYADDTQLYIPVSPHDPSSIASLHKCLADVRRWMSENFLQLNENKTEVLVLGPHSESIAPLLGALSTNLHTSARNLGVFLDSSLNFKKQISHVVKSSFFHLRSIAKLKPILSKQNLEIVVHSLITTRLDYCNSLYFGLPENLLHKLQLVQNATARFLTGTKKRDHISPVLKHLHWLPVHFRIKFKILLFVFKALHGCAPSYIANMISLYCPPRSLRSSSQRLLDVRTANLKTKGGRAFSIAAPNLWNSLPDHIRFSPSIDHFKSALKTHLFALAFNRPDYF